MQQVARTKTLQLENVGKKTVKSRTYQTFCRQICSESCSMRRRGCAAVTSRLMWNSVCACRTGSGRWRERALVFTGDGGREETLWEHPQYHPTPTTFTSPPTHSTQVLTPTLHLGAPPRLPQIRWGGGLKGMWPFQQERRKERSLILSGPL